MKLTPKTLPYGKQGAPAGKRIPILSVYDNAVRFNKAAANLLELPDRISFDLEAGTLSKDEEGFQVKICGSWKDFVIHNRNLTRYILEKLGGTKVIFRISANGDGFKMEQVSAAFFREP